MAVLLAVGATVSLASTLGHGAIWSQVAALTLMAQVRCSAREIRGLPFEWRPFSNLTWADDRTLMFDRWSSPHDGMHYALDVVGGRLVAAQSFHDRER
jgi:hypothetical protein